MTIREADVMSKIAYTHKDPQTILVKMGRKTVGRILESKMGFRYFPIGHRSGGDFYVTLAECKRSLEGDEVSE